MKHLLLATVAALCLAAPALANDTMAELRTGGLAYVITDADHPLPAPGKATNW